MRVLSVGNGVAGFTPNPQLGEFVLTHRGVVPEATREIAITSFLVVPGDKMELAMQRIFTALIWRMMERRKRAFGAL